MGWKATNKTTPWQHHGYWSSLFLIERRTIINTNQSPKLSLNPSQIDLTSGLVFRYRLLNYAIASGGIVAILTTVITRLVFGVASKTQIDIEFGDKIVWYAILLTGTYFVFIAWRYSRSVATPVMAHSTITYLAIGVLVLGLVWVDRKVWQELWYGFGNAVLVLTLIAMPGVDYMLRKASKHLITNVGIIGICITVFLYLPTVLQPSWAVIEPMHTRFVYNELLGMAAGRLPLSDFVPQYTTMLGAPFALIWSIIPGIHSLHASLLAISSYMSILSVLTLVLISMVTAFALPRKFRILAPLLTIPLILVQNQPVPVTDLARFFGSLPTIPTAIPLRSLPLFVIALIVILLIPKLSIPRAALLGLIAGVALLNNLEFGGVCAIAALAVVFAGSVSFTKSILNSATYVLGLFIPTVLYSIWLLANGKPVHLEYLALFAQTFWEGFGSLPMGYGGSQYLIIAVLIAGVGIGTYVLFSRNRIAYSELEIRAASLVTFLGLAGLGSFGYFVGRSIASTQLQIFLIFAAPIIASLITLVPVAFKNNKVNAYIVSTRILVVLLVSIPIGAIAQAPDAGVEWSRVLPSSNEKLNSSPFLTDLEKTHVAIDSINLTNPDALVNLSLSLANGNWISLETGIPNVSSIDAPAEAHKLGESIRKTYCEGLLKAQGAILVETFFNERNEPACDGYTLLSSPAEKLSLIVRNDLLQR